MSASLARTLLAWAAVATAVVAGEISFETVKFDVEGRLLDARFEDMDGDGLRDLVLAVQVPAAAGTSRRELRIHRMGADGSIAREASRVISVHDDVVVYAVADVRDEPGHELLLMTRAGVYSLSTQTDGLRENLRRLASFDLLYQVPGARNLPSMPYVVEQPGGARDLLLLPGGADISVWGPRPPTAEVREDATDYRLITDFGGNDRAALFSTKAPGALVSLYGRVRVSTDGGGSLFLGEAPAAFAAMLQADTRYRAPALVDVDGDGRDDLVVHHGNDLRLHFGGPDGYSVVPDRTETLPEFLRKPDTDVIINLRDLDGDGDVDVYARVKPDKDTLEHQVFTYYFLVNDGTRLLPDSPTDVKKFEGSGTDSQITDVDNDGRPDLVITKYALPRLQDLVTGFRFRRSANVFFADEKRLFQKKPNLQDDQVFDIESLQDAIMSREISSDFSGDGIADLVEVDLSGYVAIRRIHFEDSMFGAGEWSLDPDPWKRFDLGANLERLRLEDVNGDGVADMINPGRKALSLLLSHAGTGR